MAKSITINGEAFTIKSSNCVGSYPMRYRDLYDCYTRPSKAKQEIFAYWKDWFRSLDNDPLVNFVEFDGVYSYNCMMFTLKGMIKYNNSLYRVLIYPTHNDLIELNR